MKVTAIIQARMGSSRLPGKVLADISGKPMLWHIVNRLGYSKTLSDIIVATTVDNKDDPVVELCQECNVKIFRGSESDVLNRFYEAAKENHSDVVVRITGDCPLIDPEVADKVISRYLENWQKYDGATNALERTYPRGLDTEVFAFSVIEKAWREARDRRHREHVTLFVYENGTFKVLNVRNDQDLSHLRWTVDEEDDLRFVREIYKRLFKEKQVFLLRDVLKILKAKPGLIKINAAVVQKEVKP